MLVLVHLKLAGIAPLGALRRAQVLVLGARRVPIVDAIARLVNGWQHDIILVVTEHRDHVLGANELEPVDVEVLLVHEDRLHVVHVEIAGQLIGVAQRQDHLLTPKLHCATNTLIRSGAIGTVVHTPRRPISRMLTDDSRYQLAIAGVPDVGSFTARAST